MVIWIMTIMVIMIMIMVIMVMTVNTWCLALTLTASSLAPWRPTEARSGELIKIYGIV